MTYVVQQDGNLGSLLFFFRKFNAFLLEFIQGIVHQVIGAKGMMQPGVHSSRVDQIGHGHLIDSSQPLEPWM